MRFKAPFSQSQRLVLTRLAFTGVMGATAAASAAAAGPQMVAAAVGAATGGGGTGGGTGAGTQTVRQPITLNINGREFEKIVLEIVGSQIQSVNRIK